MMKILIKQILLLCCLTATVKYMSAQTNSGEKEIKFLDSKKRAGSFEVIDTKKQLPNIFFITVDMISPDCYHPSRELSNHIKTPSIDKIAEAGIRFNNAFCTSPLCGPSRAAIFTGRYQPYLTNGERAPLGMQIELKKEDIIFQEYLKAIGYSMKHVGKCHVGIDKFFEAFGENQHSWDRWSPPNMEDDNYLAFLQTKGIKPFRYRKEIKGKQIDRKHDGNSLGGLIEQENGEDFPVEAHYSTYLAETAIQKIDAGLQQKPDAPIYLQLDIFDPHQPYSIPSGFEKRFQELMQVVELPESYLKWKENDFQQFENEPSIYQLYRTYWGLYEPEVLKELIVYHLLQVEVVDYALGKLLNHIKKKGLWDNSLIIFSADHGDMNGRMGLVDKGVYFQPDIFRVPLYIKPPADFELSGHEYKSPVSALDISQTILDFAEIIPPGYMDGESLKPVLSGGDRGTLQQLFQTGWHVGVNYGFGYQKVIGKDHWFYGYNITTGEEELYDLSKDNQLNLIDQPDLEYTRKEIISEVAHVLQSDRRWLGYWSTFRLHNAKYLDVAENDMQMTIPAKN